MNDQFSQFFQQLLQRLPQGNNPMSGGGNPGFREGPMGAPMYDPAGAGGAQAPMGGVQQGGMNPMVMQFLQQLIGGGGFGGQQSGGQTAFAGAPGTMYAGGSPTFNENPQPAMLGAMGTGGNGMPDPNAQAMPTMPQYPNTQQSGGQSSGGPGNWMNMISGIGSGGGMPRVNAKAY